MSSNPAELDMIRCQIPTDRLEIHAFHDPEEALELLNTREVEVFLVDEDLQEGSGLDLLHDVRAVDEYTALVLLADEHHGIDLAVDAINRARVAKILTKPWDLDELTDELEDAAHHYATDVRKDRHLQLSKVRVRRLTTTINRAQSDLAQKERQLEALQRSSPSARAVLLPAATALPRQQAHSAAFEAAEGPPLSEQLPRVLSELIRANDQDGCSSRVVELVEGSIDRLGWSEEEREKTVLAARLHHAYLPLYPRETLVEVRGGSTRHASELAEAIEHLPGLAEVAEIIAQHHAPLFDRNEKTVNVGRCTRLLQILSLFDEISNDEEIVQSEQAELDSEYGLNRASEQLLRLSGTALLPNLCDMLVKDVIPTMLGRDERCVSTDQLFVGQTLTRTVYSENLALARTGTVLSASAIDRIRTASETTGTAGVWVLESDAPDADVEAESDEEFANLDTGMVEMDTAGGPTVSDGPKRKAS